MLSIRQGTLMQRLRSARVCTLLGLALLSSSSPAQAQQPPAPAASAEAQQPAAQHSWSLAAALFAEGTKLFQQWRFDEAEQKFREALAHGDHTIIYLYLSRALEKQGRLVEAYEALRLALRSGVESLPLEDVQVAEELQKSMESRLAQIEVSCDVPGAEVSLDGEPWFTAPGRQRRMMSAGQHVLIARKPGYFPVAEPVSLIPGKQSRAVLRMTADVVRTERRWRRWQPWVVAGTGIAISLAGGLLRRQATSDYAFFKNALDSCYPGYSCQFVPTQRFDSGVWKERVGTGALIIGGSILTTGLAGVLLNQPSIQRSEPAEGMEYEILPMAAEDTVGIAVRGHF